MLLFFATASLSDPEQEKADYLYYKYRHILYTCAIKIIKNPDLAEDIIQNTFVSVIQNLDAIEDCDSKRTCKYLITATSHFAFQEYKKQKWDTKNKVDIDEVVDTLAANTNVWDEVKSRAELREIFEAFEKLNTGHRFLIIGKYYYGYTYRELAKMINTTENGVSTRIVLAKRKLAEILGKEGVNQNER